MRGSNSREISSEAIYDEKVSPLVSDLIQLCKKQNVPLLTCSTFISTDEEIEGSCSSCVIGNSASLRMKEIAPMAMNHGKPGISTFAKIMTSEYSNKELDANWYKSKHKKDFPKIVELLKKIQVLVDITYKFPTAIIVQTPNPGSYMIVGGHPSDGTYDGIQFMRVIAEHGYSPKSLTLLSGGEDKSMTKNMLRIQSMGKMTKIGKNKK